jgi:predicted ATPase
MRKNKFMIVSGFLGAGKTTTMTQIHRKDAKGGPEGNLRSKNLR